MAAFFNPYWLIIARESRGITQKTLAAQLEITPGQLSRIENGLKKPTRDIVRRMSEVLRFPVSFFVQPDTVYGLPTSIHSATMFRKKASVGQGQINRLYAELNIRLMHLRRMFKAVEFEGELPWPRFDIEEYGDNPETVADLLRSTWLLPPGPIKNLTACLERAGIVVVWHDFMGAAIDAISMAVRGFPPIVFLNQDHPADRMRFSLAHELGHLIMHTIPTPDMEAEATRFASAFLMPAKDIREHLRGPITLERLGGLKPIWRVAIQALLMRAKALGLITDNQNRYLWQQISLRGMRLHEPPSLDFPKEKPQVMPMILRLYLEEFDFSVEELAKALRVYKDDLRRLYPIENEKSLRLVK